MPTILQNVKTYCFILKGMIQISIKGKLIGK